MESGVLRHDFRGDVGYCVHRAAQRFERAMNHELSAEGLTYRQGQVLGWIAIDGELAQVELADRMNLEPPTLVRVLDGMERAGLIERIGCPGDRRRKVIRATERALPVWEKIVACANRVRDRAVGRLSSDEQELLRRLLETVHENLGTDASPAGCCSRDDDREAPVATASNGVRTNPRI
jgi:MarR family transcriptional regulator, transcriptional regulator for hemolysin